MRLNPEGILRLRALMANVRAELEHLQATPAMAKAARGTTPAQKTLYRLILALRKLSTTVHDEAFPSADAVQDGIQAVRELQVTAAANLPPDWTLARRDWVYAGQQLSVECSDLADEIEAAKPSDRPGLLVRAGVLLWAFVDPWSVLGSPYKGMGLDDSLADAERDYQTAKGKLESHNAELEKRGYENNPRVFEELQNEFWRQSGRLRTLRAKNGILS